MSTDTLEKEPDWEAIAYELASLVDDIDLYFQIEQSYTIEGRNRQISYESPREMFLIKKFIAAQKHFLRYKNQLLYISDYKREREQDEKRRIELMTSLSSFKK